MYPTRSARRLLSTATLAALLAAAPALPGCSLFVPPKQSVTLQSNDPRATLYADGKMVGTGSATLKLRRNDSHIFRAETPDGRTATARVSRTISDTGVLDVVGGVIFLVPFLGVLAPGFWNLSQDFLYLDVPPAAGSGGSGGAGRGAEVPTTAGMR